MNQKKNLEEIMGSLFSPDPAMPKNFLIPAITAVEGGEKILSCLILAKEAVKTFFETGEAIGAGIELRRDETSTTNDFLLNAVFVSGEKEIEVKTLIEGTDKGRQNKFLQDIKSCKRVTFWVADETLHLIKLLEIPFDVTPYTEEIEEVLQKEYIV